MGLRHMRVSAAPFEVEEIALELELVDTAYMFMYVNKVGEWVVDSKYDEDVGEIIKVLQIFLDEKVEEKDT